MGHSTSSGRNAEENRQLKNRTFMEATRAAQEANPEETRRAREASERREAEARAMDEIMEEDRRNRESRNAILQQREQRREALAFMRDHADQLNTERGVVIANLPGGVKLENMTARQMVDALNEVSGGQYELVTRSRRTAMPNGTAMNLGTEAIRKKKKKRNPPRPRGVAANSQLGRAWKEAQNGNASSVVRDYAQQIQAAQTRMRNARNGYVKQAAQQEVERLTNERRRIERAFLD